MRSGPPLPVPRLALVDLDGTLVDTLPDLAWSVDRACEALGLPARGEAAVRGWVGDGVDRLVRRALTARFDGEPDEDLRARGAALFERFYACRSGAASRVYPGVTEGLDFLAGAGARLACVTNKPARFAEPLLAALGLRDRFALVVSGDTVARRKPDPLPLEHAARVLGVERGHALAIGDSANDVRAAHAAGMRVVAVSYGYDPAGDVARHAPDALVDSLAELPEVLAPA